MPGLFAASERRAGSLLGFITLVKQSSSMPIGDATRLRNVFNVGFGSIASFLQLASSLRSIPNFRHVDAPRQLTRWSNSGND